MSEKKRVLKYEIRGVNVDEQWFEIAITEQSHRGEEFTTDGSMFIACNGVRLESGMFPQTARDYGKGKYYVRGCSFDADNKTFRVSFSSFNAFAEAVKEYNLLHGEEDCYGKVRARFVQNIQLWIDRHNERVAEALVVIRNATTLKEAREAKMNLMLTLIQIPRTHFYCPDCLVQVEKHNRALGDEEGCLDCPLGKEKGNCNGEESTPSAYEWMVNARENLYTAIEFLYDVKEV